MKIRIQGNAVRFRLSKTEVEKLAATGYLEEKTNFGTSVFTYAIQKTSGTDSLSAHFDRGKLTLHAPASFLSGWSNNNVVGLDGNMPVQSNETLYLLLEKDFKCLDNSTEDQSDNYENPKINC